MFCLSDFWFCDCSFEVRLIVDILVRYELYFFQDSAGLHWLKMIQAKSDDLESLFFKPGVPKSEQRFNDFPFDISVYITRVE